MDSTPKITPLPSREAIRKHRQERLENGMLFPLNATSIGLEDTIYARIRRITTLDRAVIAGLPNDLQETLFQGINEFQQAMKNADGREDPQSMLEMLANNDTILEAADTWCTAAFIHPKLVKTEAEIDSPTTWLVADVEPEDRVAVFMLSLDADSPQVKKLKLFRPAGRSAALHDAHVPVAPDTVRVLETVGAGVHGDGAEGV